MPSDGILFLCFFGITMYYTYREAAGGATHKRTHAKNVDKKAATQGLGTGRAVVYLVGGLVALVYGGELIVDGAQGLARGFGLSERVIGLAIVGPGTSVPELIASIVAARKGNVGMVMGNVLGSNIFNVFFTLGITSIIMPVPLDLALNEVVIANIAVTALLVLWVTVLRRRRLGRPLGVVLLAAYATNMFFSLRA
jgi:cation:H+ antiporter